jgi:hypothetical protein
VEEPTPLRRVSVIDVTGNCPICNEPVHRRHDHGRPPMYCGPKHRRVAERRELHRLARLGRAVERAMRDAII